MRTRDLQSRQMFHGVCALIALTWSACASEPDLSTQEQPAPALEPTAEPEPVAETHIEMDGDVARFRTQSFTLEPGQERFLCFAASLDEEFVAQGYASSANPLVHHVVFVRTLLPEPAGTSECDVLFRRSWDPLFVAGAGDSIVDFPSDAGHQLSSGTQLLAQLHLLNSTDRPVTHNAEIVMKRSSAERPRPVGTFVFGTQELELPPGERSEVEAECTLQEPVQLVAAFPHMHLMGRALSFAVGPSAAALETVFHRDPYDFDNQRMEVLDLRLQPGDVTRVRCAYENTSDREIGFGESTLSEMCFFIGFALDSSGLRVCDWNRQRR